MDFVEMLRPGEQLAQDDRRPALREHLTSHRIAGWMTNPRSLRSTKRCVV